MREPLVTVILPAYNQEKYIASALASVFDQSYKNLEILVVDDASTDSTAKIVEKDKRVRLIQLGQNEGPAAARNRGVEMARGEYVCMLDSDDTMDRDRISKLLAIFERNPQLDVVFHAIFIMDEEGKKIGEMRCEWEKQANFLVRLFFRNALPAQPFMAKRSCLQECPYNESLRHAEDYDLMLRLAQRFHLYYLDEPLLNYRRHALNLSENLEAHRAGELAIVRQYSWEEIEKVVGSSTFSQEEKQLWLGKIAFNREEYKRAIHIFEKVGTGLAHFYLGNCYYKEKMFEKALKAYLHSLEMDPDNAACWNNVGALYLLLKQSDRAKNYLEKALLLKKGYLDAEYNLKGLGQPRVTFKELRKALMPYRTI